MRRKPNDLQSTRWTPLIFLSIVLITCSIVYSLLRLLLASSDPEFVPIDLASTFGFRGDLGFGSSSSSGCCRGINKLELWGAAVKWGSDFKFNTSEECCSACKAMCTGIDGPCLCDTWVFCEDKLTCGSRFGECWLKKQKDTLAPDKEHSTGKIGWTSGLMFGKGEGIVGLETEYGTLRLKLYPNCAPHSVNYILDLLASRYPVGFRFYRGESRGHLWDSEGVHIKNANLGPPFALLQGTLESESMEFPAIPSENRPTIERGSVAWVNNGPEFFISLANHNEWKQVYTVFGSVLREDMGIADKIGDLPTNTEIWNHINVSVLKNPVRFWVRRTAQSRVGNPMEK